MHTDRRRRNLERLLRPRSIAVVGGRAAEAVIRQCRKFGFAGPIHAVSARRAELAGVPCVARIEDLPEPPDAAFLAIGREATVDAVAALAALGAGGAVAYAAGFAEVDDGRALERQLIEVAGDMAVLGPNCYGLLNLLDGVALWPDEHGGGPVQRGIALISQSGNIAITLTMQERGLPIAAVLSVGNQAQLAAHDLIDVLADDPRITAIGLYLETVADPAGFARAALKCAARRLPVVALKTGRSEAGARTALSHTRSLAGRDALVDVFLRRYGIARVDTLAELLESLKLLHVHGPLPGRRIGSLSCSGGDAAMVADLAAPTGLELPPLPEASRAALAQAEVLGPRVAIANPLDYHTYIWGDAEGMRGCFGAMLGAGFDATLLVLDWPRPGENDHAAWDLAADAMSEAAAATGGRALVVSSLPETLPRPARERLMAAGIAPMQGLAECLRALAGAARIGESWRRSAAQTPHLPPAAGAIGHHGEAFWLQEGDAKRRLATWGLRVPEGEVVPVEDAAATAVRIGFPVVVKTSAHIAHKTDAGGVALNLRSADEVAAAARRLAKLGAEVLVERMLPPPVAELILGIDVDAQFGPHLLIGAGGVQAELWRDVALLLLPAAPEEVEDALRMLRIWPLLRGWRGGPPADIGAVVDAACRLGALALDPEAQILELDINPLLVYPDGAIVADALIRVGGGGRSEMPEPGEQVA